MVDRDARPATYLALGRNLLRTGSRLRDAVGRRTQREFGITALQGDMLLLLAGRQSMICAELAAACGVNASTVTHAVDAAIGRGLMRRDRNVGDRRLVDIAITPEGVAVATRMETLLAEVAADAVHGMSPAEITRFAAGVARVGRNLAAP
ncbi:MarR family transcriptional regulator [Luteibacter sp. PPL201]|uniref:MarR family transcriptional regulator n=1 Tax=Luteibacter sahnii TaxID=3021977 RepID=A0ABT6B9G7_9GAMM